jgi:hypothetical protein
MDHTSGNSQEWAARTDCESALSVTAAKSQSSARRKPKRVLWLSAQRDPPGYREESAVENVGPAEPAPDFVRGRKFRTGSAASPAMTNQSASVDCGVHAGRSPINLNSVAQVTTGDRQKTNCDVSWAQVQRAIQMA